MSHIQLSICDVLCSPIKRKEGAPWRPRQRPDSRLGLCIWKKNSGLSQRFSARSRRSKAAPFGCLCSYQITMTAFSIRCLTLRIGLHLCIQVPYFYLRFSPSQGRDLRRMLYLARSQSTIPPPFQRNCQPSNNTSNAPSATKNLRSTSISTKQIFAIGL